MFPRGFPNLADPIAGCTDSEKLSELPIDLTIQIGLKKGHFQRGNNLVRGMMEAYCRESNARENATALDSEVTGLLLSLLFSPRRLQARHGRSHWKYRPGPESSRELTIRPRLCARREVEWDALKLSKDRA